MTVLPKTLEVSASLTEEGIDIAVNGDHFPIRYEKEIWSKFPAQIKEIFLDNLTYSSTLFLPQMLNLNSIRYKTSRPLSEAFLFKNGIYDMPNCAEEDQCSSADYIKRFFNTIGEFADNCIKKPDVVDFGRQKNARLTAVIPFSFGKECMLSLALCQELGIEPILVNFIEPVNEFEHMHKQRMFKDFEERFNVKIHTVYFGPSLLRYGHHWGLQSELGWGLQTTEYALLCLPFVSYFNADYIILGNEQSCNFFTYDDEGILNYECGYDQHNDWTPQQSLLSSLLLGRQIDVITFMEPLHEIAISRILHHRYPEYGKFQMSCMADNKDAAKNRWCQSCLKCSLMYTLCGGTGANLESIGFTENLFDKKDNKLFCNFFTYFSGRKGLIVYEELRLALYLSARLGLKGDVIDDFNHGVIKIFEPKVPAALKEYFGLHSDSNIPDALKPVLLKIYQEELKSFTDTL